MKEAGMYGVKTRLSELAGEVESGQQFVITRCGVAVSRLVAAVPTPAGCAQGNAQRECVKQAFAELAQLRSGTVLDLPCQKTLVTPGAIEMPFVVDYSVVPD